MFSGSPGGMIGLAGNKVPDKEPIQLDGLAGAFRPGVDRAVLSGGIVRLIRERSLHRLSMQGSVESQARSSHYRRGM